MSVSFLMKRNKTTKNSLKNAEIVNISRNIIPSDLERRENNNNHDASQKVEDISSSQLEGIVLSPVEKEGTENNVFSSNNTLIAKEQEISPSIDSQQLAEDVSNTDENNNASDPNDLFFKNIFPTQLKEELVEDNILTMVPSSEFIKDVKVTQVQDVISMPYLVKNPKSLPKIINESINTAYLLEERNNNKDHYKISEEWEEVLNSLDIKSQIKTYGLKAIAYKNKVTREVLFAFAGTDPLNLDDLIDDARLFFGYPARKFAAIKQFVNEVEKIIGSEALKNAVGAGHSLGTELNLLFGAILQSQGHGTPRMINFEDPGGSLKIVKYLRNKSKFSGEHEVITEELSKNCITYLSTPNFINSMDHQLAFDNLFITLPSESDSNLYSKFSDLMPVLNVSPLDLIISKFTKFIDHYLENHKTHFHQTVKQIWLTVNNLYKQIKSHGMENFKDLADKITLKLDSDYPSALGNQVVISEEEFKKLKPCLSKFNEHRDDFIMIRTHEEKSNGEKEPFTLVDVLGASFKDISPNKQSGYDADYEDNLEIAEEFDTENSQEKNEQLAQNETVIPVKALKGGLEDNELKILEYGPLILELSEDNNGYDADDENDTYLFNKQALVENTPEVEMFYDAQSDEKQLMQETEISIANNTLVTTKPSIKQTILSTVSSFFHSLNPLYTNANNMNNSGVIDEVDILGSSVKKPVNYFVNSIFGPDTNDNI